MKGFDLSATNLMAIRMLELVAGKVYGNGVTFRALRGEHNPITDETLVHAVSLGGCIVHYGGQTPFTCVASLRRTSLESLSGWEPRSLTLSDGVDKVQFHFHPHNGGFCVRSERERGASPLSPYRS